MVGLYGGSFDPVHIGHLRIAEDIREYYGLDKITFIPAYHSPLKPKSKAPPQDRLKMLELSIRDNPYFSVDSFEIDRQEKSYTIDTFRYFKSKGVFPLFIVGTDAFLTLHRWKEPQELVSSGSFIVVGRGGDSLEKVKKYVEEHFPQMEVTTSNVVEKEAGKVYFFDGRRLDVSSTEIRKRVREGKSIKYLVLPEVEKYI
ncbi:MAG: nicotinate (nicotinamide) nucleotide adenylyltransferase, partial [Aquificae bacterium]|nr:nicotinate (nicotinamide) nucleotide adenylyltransferase [Aquificota bacterium]